MYCIYIISNTDNNQEGIYCRQYIIQMEKESHVDWMT